ncbi:hypothetical protein [Rhizobium sp. NPDC090279]|uniref:hypothetical protein n=1 Tax=Rhizobium sp. NPDC090279 TaxID=3364499 RepID=UPI003839D05A
MITGPRFPRKHPSRLRDCQRAIVNDLNELLDRADRAGWNRSEVLVALADLLDAETGEDDQLLRAMADYVRHGGTAAA